MQLATPVALPIYHMRDPHFPHLAFEFHQATGKVYVGWTPGRWLDGEFVPDPAGARRWMVLAEHCDTHGRAHGFVQTYLRGYRQGKHDAGVLARGETRLMPGYPGGGPVVEKG